MSAVRLLPARIQSRIRWTATVATAGLLGVLAAPAPAPAATAPAIHDPALRHLVATAPASRVVVIAQFRAGVSVAQADRLVRAAGGSNASVVPLIHALAARMTPRAANRLARRPQVRAVSLNARVKQQAAATYPNPAGLGTTFVQSTGTDGVWSKATGKGIGVAVIDSGIDGDLPDFATSAKDPTSRVVTTVVTNPYATDPTDPVGHGTHVAGLIAGNGNWRTDVDHSRFAGTAPDASLISVKAGDDQGNASVLDVIYGIAFVVTHASDYNIKVVNLSLESASPESYNTSPLDAVVEAAWFSGVTVVTAVGNRGSDADAVDYAPGNDPYVISVGGVDENGTRSTNDDTIASWSSRGTTMDGFAKPDVYAPGAHMLSTLAPNSAFASLCPSCVLDGAYIKVSGTSMAAPVVAGIAADLLQLHPTWTPDQVKGAIVNTTNAIAGSSAGEVNALAASRAGAKQLVANANQQPSKLLLALAQAYKDGTSFQMDVGSGTIDATRSRWSRSSWSAAPSNLSADWARSSWSCTCSRDDSGAIDPTRSSWSRSSWSSR